MAFLVYLVDDGAAVDLVLIVGVKIIDQQITHLHCGEQPFARYFHGLYPA